MAAPNPTERGSRPINRVKPEEVLGLTGGRGVRSASGPAFIYFPKGEGTVLLDMRGKVKEVSKPNPGDSGKSDTVVLDGKGTLIEGEDSIVVYRIDPKNRQQVVGAKIVRDEGVVEIFRSSRSEFSIRPTGRS